MMELRNGEDELLTAEILGLRLANPVLVASGPLSDSLLQIRRALKAGAGGVVTKTIYIGDKLKIKERVRMSPEGAFNSTTYSHVNLEKWLQTLATLAVEGAPVIASIHAYCPEQLGELARLVVEAGSPALELGICCPIDVGQSAADWRLIGLYTKAVRQAVDAPFSVKLTAIGSLLDNAKAAIGEGADAISLSDSLPSLLVDIKQRSLPLGSSVGYSGPAIKPIVLHAIYELRQAGITCPLMGIGGVGSAVDVLEYLQIGANTVQLYTMLMKSKLKLLTSITGDLFAWCKKEGVTVHEVVGTALTEALI